MVVDIDDRLVWTEMPDHDCLIIAGLRPGGWSYHFSVNPEIPWRRGDVAIGWAAALLTRIEAHGFERAMAMDGWFERSDGDWQMWGRSVDFGDLAEGIG
ncbi:hypothetical protein GALL_330270 [mine drainage metagenome]|uniref:Uncharacterized protein n=1 Tax=mine drainage metagenome TaxID=410659 RepID=A0A1J5RAF7_9ZZZZ